MNNNSSLDLVETREIIYFLPLMKELTEFNERFLLAMLRWCGYGRRRSSPLLYWKVYITFQDKVPVAVSGLYQDTETSQKSYWLGWFGVRPNFRRLHIGKFTITKLIEFCRDLNAKELLVYIDINDGIASKFYTSLGFIHLGIAKDIFPQSNFDNFEPNDLIMKYSIS